MFGSMAQAWITEVSMEVGGSETPEPQPPPPPPPPPIVPPIDQSHGTSAPGPGVPSLAYSGPAVTASAPVESVSGFYDNSYGSFSQYRVQQYPDPQVRKLLVLEIRVSSIQRRLRRKLLSELARHGAQT